MKIGVMAESFRCDFRTAIEKAAALGADGVQKYAVGEELNWNDAQIKEALDIVKSNGMVFSALCGDFGCGFGNPERNPEIIEKSKRVIELAKKLECNVVTTHIGHLTAEETPTKEIMRKACRELAIFADSMEAAFAVETGPETGEILGEFLDSLGAGGVRVNFDPANLVMCAGDRPENALKYIGKYVVHTHAKDGLKLIPTEKDEILTYTEAQLATLSRYLGKSLTVGEEHDQLAGMGQAFIELPLGEGGVDFDVYLPALAASGFDGFLTIEREVGDSPEADIALAVNFLKEKKSKFSL